MSLKNLNAIKIHKNLKSKLSNKKILKLFNTFEKDFNISLSEAEKLIGDIELNNTQKCCIIQMVYQLGGPRTSKFKKMWKALEEGDALTASAEILDSRWHAQTPGRCEEVAEEMAGSSL